MKTMLLALFLITGLTAKTIAIQQTIYLTLDDGPLPESKCIDSLVRVERIAVNIFAVGANLSSKEGRINYARYKSNPHIKIFNHSYSHANGHYRKYYRDTAAVLKDFQKNDSLLNPFSSIIRMPGRNMWRINGRSKNDITNGIEAADHLAANGYTIIGWDIAWLQDSITKEPSIDALGLMEVIEHRLKRRNTFTKDHLVLLLHDEMFCSAIIVNELKKLIEEINRKKLRFAYLDSYPLINK